MEDEEQLLLPGESESSCAGCPIASCRPCYVLGLGMSPLGPPTNMVAQSTLVPNVKAAVNVGDMLGTPGALLRTGPACRVIVIVMWLHSDQ